MPNGWRGVVEAILEACGTRRSQIRIASWEISGSTGTPSLGVRPEVVAFIETHGVMIQEPNESGGLRNEVFAKKNRRL